MRNASKHRNGGRGECSYGGEGPRGGRFGGPRGGGREGPRGSRGGGFRHGPFEMLWSFEGGRRDGGGLGRGPGGRGPGGRGSGPRGPRRLNGDQLRLLLLKLVGDQPRHGYDLIRAIEELTGGAYAPSAGMVYPTLNLLDEMGQIAAEAEGAKKIYAVTASGTAELEANAAAIDEIVTALKALGERQQRADRSPVRRAMHNLRGVLANRLSVDGDGELAHQIAEILDETTRRIERL